MEKQTTEDALRTLFSDWRERSKVANAAPGEIITVYLTVTFEVPSTYAKAILRDVLLEELEASTQLVTHDTIGATE